MLDHRKSKGILKSTIYFCFIDCAKAFDCVNQNKLWRILKEMGIPDHLTCLLRNLYAGQEATVRTEHGKLDWFKIGKKAHQGCILSPCLFNLCRVHHEKCQAGWIIGWTQDCWEKYQMCRWYHFSGKNEEELKRLLMKVKEESEKVGLKVNIQKTKIMAPGSTLHGK